MTALDLGVRDDVDRGAVLARANPVAKLAVATTVAMVLLVRTDPVTPGVALLLELACLPLTGVPLRAALRRSWIVLLAAFPTGVVTALLGVDAGGVLAGLGPVTVTEGSALAGLAITLRVLAIGLPGVLLVLSTDPTDLADALAQVLRLPHRFVLAALAATRLLGVMAAEWDQLSLARRARGLGDDGVLGRARTFGTQVFALLVLALRRGGVLATTMESRGFGATGRRTWARPSRMSGSDWLVVAGGCLLVGTAFAAGAFADVAL